jgi:hypothetical protein
MSLEAALQVNTSTMKALIAVLSTIGTIGNVAAEVAADAGDKPRRGRKTNAEKEAAAATTTVVATAGTDTVTEGPFAGRAKPLAEGVLTPIATLFFIAAEKNTAYKVMPGEPLVVLPGAVECTEADHDAFKAKVTSGNVVAASVAQSTTPATSPTTSAADAGTPASAELDALFGGVAETPASLPVMTFQEVTTHLVALAKGTNPGQGREVVMKLVADAGAKDVPSLQTLGAEKFSAVGHAAKKLLG